MGLLNLRYSDIHSVQEVRYVVQSLAMFHAGFGNSW
jgi:hypothetical protein